MENRSSAEEGLESEDQYQYCERASSETEKSWGVGGLVVCEEFLEAEPYAKRGGGRGH